MYGDAQQQQQQQLNDVEMEEVQTLRSLFSDLDPLLVSALYLQNDRDYKATQQALADLATHPHSAAAGLLPVSRSTSGQHQQGYGASAGPERSYSGSGAAGAGAAAAGAGGLAALALAPAPSDKDDGSMAAYLPQLPSFDVNTITDTLSQVGASVTDGITSLATNITGWVADLASAFDAGWGDEEGEERPVHASDKNEPAVGYGSGMGIERPYQRRLGASSSTALTAGRSQRIEADAADAGDDDEWNEDGDEDGKDD